MKRLILILGGFLIITAASAQSQVGNYKYKSDTSQFRRYLSKGDEVYIENSGQAWRIDSATPSKTLSLATWSHKTLLGSGGGSIEPFYIEGDAVKLDDYKLQISKNLEAKLKTIVGSYNDYSWSNVKSDSAYLKFVEYNTPYTSKKENVVHLTNNYNFVGTDYVSPTNNHRIGMFWNYAQLKLTYDEPPYFTGRRRSLVLNDQGISLSGFTTTQVISDDDNVANIASVKKLVDSLGGASPWRNEYGDLSYPATYGFNFGVPNESGKRVAIKYPYLGDVQRKGLTEYDLYNLLSYKIGDSTFRVIANKYANVNTSFFGGNMDSVNAYLTNFPSNTLTFDTITTLHSNWTVPDGMELIFTKGGKIEGAFTITGNNTVIDAGDEALFATNVTQTGTWKADKVYASWFGAVGDGITDDKPAIEKAIDFLGICSYNVFEFSKDKNYLMGTTTTKTVDYDINIEGNNATLVFEHKDGPTGQHHILQFYNEPISATGKQVTANITKGSNQVTLNNVTDLKVYQMVKFNSSEIWEQEDGYTPYYKAFVSYIIDITGNVITIADMFPFSMLSANMPGGSTNGVFAYERNQLSITNLNFKAIGTSSTSQKVIGFRFYNFFNPVFENIKGSGTYSGLGPQYCYKATLKRVTITDKDPIEGTALSTYGITVEGSNHTVIDGAIVTTNGHCITHTGAPSVDTQIVNSFLKQVGDTPHSLDGHSVISVYARNSTIYGSWALYETISFTECTLYTGKNSTEASFFTNRGGFRANQTFIIDNCDIYANASSTDVAVIAGGFSASYTPAGDMGSYKITNSRIYNNTGRTMYMHNLVKGFSGTILDNGGGNFIVSGNKLSGDNDFGLTVKSTYSISTTKFGVFEFTNNTYSKLNIQNGIDEYFYNKYEIKNNIPFNDDSKITVNLSSFAGKMIFDNNKIQTDAFKIYNVSGQVSFANNKFINAKGVGLMKVDKLSGNTSNGYPIFDGKAPDDFYDLTNNADYLHTAINLSGLSTWTINIKAKLKDNGSATEQAIWGASTTSAQTKYRLYYISSADILRLTLRNASGDYNNFDYANFNPDTLWHTFTGYMDISASDTAHVLLMDGIELQRISFPAAKNGGGTFVWTTMYASGYIDFMSSYNAWLNKGKIANASIYNRKLTQEEISLLINNDGYQFTNCLGNWSTGKTATSWIDGVGTTNITIVPSSHAIKFNQKYNSVNNLFSNGKFSYSDNAYGTFYYNGGGYVLSTSGTTTKQLLTIDNRKDYKNIDISSNKIVFTKTGKYKIEPSVFCKNSSATCNTFSIVAELYNATNVKQDQTIERPVQSCTAAEFNSPDMSTIFNVANAGDYVVLKAGGNGASVNLNVVNTVVVISKIDE